MALEDFKFSAILGLIGLLIGLLLPSGLGVLSNIDYTQASEDPVNFLTGYVIVIPLAITIEIFSSLFVGLIMGTIGIILDMIIFIKNSSSSFL